MKLTLLILLSLAVGAADRAEIVRDDKTLDCSLVQPRSFNLPIRADGLTSDGGGWAVAVGVKDGSTLLLTAYHIVEDSHTLKLRPVRVQIDKQWHDCTLLRWDREKDLVLMCVKAKCDVIPIADSPGPKNASTSTYWMQIEGALPGWSGSGVLDTDGRLYGLIIRVAAMGNTPIIGEATCRPAPMLRAFVEGK